MIRTFALVLPLLTISQETLAQNRNNIWYFGGYAGLDFNSTPPTPLLDGRYTGGGACGSICDTAGGLVFYNAPDTLYTAAHDTMTWGSDLYGDASAASGIVVPWPAHPLHYYIFMAKSVGSPDYDPGAFYHLVDMSQAGGAGACIEKAVPLYDSVSVMATAIPHANGIDYWALFHEWGTNRFLAYLVDMNGLSATPVFSSTGQIHHTITGAEASGLIRPSSDGSRLAVSKYRHLGGPGYLDLFSFDRWTGAVSELIRVEGDQRFTYSEFSPNGHFLYASIFRCDAALTNDLVQYDISEVDSASIADSRTVLYAAPYQTNCDGSFGMSVLGPDNKIYVAVRAAYSLGVVNEPDLPGTACDFQYGALSLAGRINNLGLPNQVKFQDSTNTAIAEHFNNHDGISVWPVPVSDELVIDIEDAVPSNGLQLLWRDQLGRIVRVNALIGKGPWSVERGALAAGSYTLAITDRSGAVVRAGRAILE